MTYNVQCRGIKAFTDVRCWELARNLLVVGHQGVSTMMRASTRGHGSQKAFLEARK